MIRPIWFFIGAICGLVILLCAVLIPAHLRAVDVKVIERAGEIGPTLIESESSLLNLEKSGPAKMLGQAARMLGLGGQEQLEGALAKAAAEPAKAPPVVNLDLAVDPLGDSRPVIELLMEHTMRQKLIHWLQTSRRP